MKRGQRHALRQNRREPGKHVIHDRLGNGLEALPVAGGEIEGARLVATDHTDRPSPRIVEWNREGRAGARSFHPS